MKMKFRTFFGFFVLVFAVACGKEPTSPQEPPPPPPPPKEKPTITSVTVSPPKAKIPIKQLAKFFAKVEGTGDYDSTVVWSIKGDGTVSSSGIYHAPSHPTIDLVIATAAADSTKADTAKVTVILGIDSVFVSPDSVTLKPGDSQQFTATVIGSNPDKSVQWSANHGTIDTTGLYNAPSAEVVDTVQVRSTVDTTKMAEAVVVVKEPPPPPPPPSDTFTTVKMNNRRNRLGAVALENGNILVWGGQGGGAPQSAEIFDAASETFIPVADALRDSRMSSAGSLLKDGRVLITGGWSSSGGIRSTEIFDPATQTFALSGSSGSLETGRYRHTQLTLCDGSVIVIGGESQPMGGDKTIFSSIERYNPSSGEWQTVAQMAEPRSLHRSVLLPNCKVLIVGGYHLGADGVLARIEIYDPATNTVASCGNINTPRYSPTLTKIPGRNEYLVAGGDRGNGNFQRSAEILDPTTCISRYTNDMSLPRVSHQAQPLPNGNILIASGSTRDNTGWPTTETAEIFDAASETFIPVASLHQSRTSFQSALLPDGRPIFIGGVEVKENPYRTNILDTAEIYFP